MEMNWNMMKKSQFVRLSICPDAVTMMPFRQRSQFEFTLLTESHQFPQRIPLRNLHATLGSGECSNHDVTRGQRCHR